MLTTGTVDPQLISADPDAGQSSEEPRIPLLVRGRVDLDAIARLNGEVQTQAGPVTTILAPLASIPAMLDLNGVEAIDAPRSLELLLNTSTANIAAPLMWGGTPPSYPGYSGRGVLIGIVDTGIDVAHADFRTSANQTRIKYLWDQTGSGSPPAGFCCGREYTEAQINAGSVSEVDNNGHGTHIAGIAASNGRATGLGYPMYRYVGVAPEADLVVVKTNQMLIETDVINGVNYIFQKATSLGKDCVVLLAVGHNRGGHDGSHSLDVALSALTGPRKIIVVAAGNQGGQALHAQINPASGQTSTTTFTIPTYTPAPSVTEQLGIEGWHGTGARFNVKLTSPGGFTTGWVAPGAARVTVSSTDGTFFLDNDLTTNSKGAKQVLAWIWDAGNGYTPRVGTWRLDYQRLSGTTTGLLDAWIADWKFGSGNVSPVFTSMVSYTQLIQTPATGDSIISVGAFSTKVRWKTMSGDSSYFFDNPPLEAIASFSSPGPRRDGVQRPDLVAPGQGVGSSLAAAASPMILNTFKLEDGAHWIYRGTSAAAAHVAGAVALLLQQTPHMSPSAARLALRAKTKVDSYTGAVPNATWGYGKLHFTSSTPTGVDDGFAGSLEFYPASPNPTRGEIGFDFVISMADLPTGTESVRLRIFDMSGREVAVLSGQTTIGRQHLVWNGLGSNNRPAAGGVYFGRLEVGTHRAVRKFIRLS
ncbi:MAG TPA: S8 family peptidase [Candidatus Eisenbacteria bacterium]|nr:S8 family peptidase [Candidatus Eisenbacteria bacterium]